MLYTLLLSGYIPPSSEAINFCLGLLAVSVVVGVGRLVWGVKLLRRAGGYAKAGGILLIMTACAGVVLTLNLLDSIF